MADMLTAWDQGCPLREGRGRCLHVPQVLWAVEGLVCQGGQLVHGEVFGHGSLLEHLVDYGAVQHLLRTAVKTLQTEETENVTWGWEKA